MEIRVWELFKTDLMVVAFFYFFFSKESSLLRWKFIALPPSPGLQ